MAETSLEVESEVNDQESYQTEPLRSELAAALGDDDTLQGPAPVIAVVAATLAFGTGLWPADVPPSEQAQAILARALDGSRDLDPALTIITAAVVETLVPLQRAALRDEIESAEASRVLRIAAATHWRLSVAVATVPSLGTDRDQAALDELYAEADRSIADLTALAAAPRTVPNVAVLILQIRDDLTHLIVDFSPAIAHGAAIAPARTQRRVAPKARSVAAKAARPWARKVRSKAPGRILGAVVVLGLSGLGYLAFADHRSPTLFAPLEGAPAGMLAVDNKEDGVRLVLRPTKAVAIPAFDDWLVAQVGQGWTVVEREPAGSGSYLLTHPH